MLDFWFGAANTPEHGQRRALWFRKDDVFDDLIRVRFLSLYARAAAGDLDAWRQAPRSLLALIVVLDQFSRNIFRGQAQAFATDVQALAAARHMLACAWDVSLSPLERCFGYLPFEHAEDLATQQRAVELFAALDGDTQVGDMSEWARRHHAVIARFGRFPHRNAVLDRVSTPAELEFLAQPGSYF